MNPNSASSERICYFNNSKFYYDVPHNVKCSKRISFLLLLSLGHSLNNLIIKSANSSQNYYLNLTGV